MTQDTIHGRSLKAIIHSRFKAECCFCLVFVKRANVKESLQSFFSPYSDSDDVCEASEMIKSTYSRPLMLYVHYVGLVMKVLVDVWHHLFKSSTSLASF